MPPTATDAAQVASAFAGAPVQHVRRFPLGLAHFVYEARLTDGTRVVVRMAADSSPHVFDGAKYWNGTLRALGVPLPALLGCGEHAGIQYVLLERLPGKDLGLVYPSLTPAAKREIAAAVAQIQAMVAALPEGRGFGYVARPEGPFTQTSWVAVVLNLLRRSRARLHAAQLVDPGLTAGVERAIQKHASYLGAVRATPFLDDTTTKNVLVEGGRLTGIVDVDCICYGDPLFPVALTWAALQGEGHETDYIEYWCDILHLTPEQRRALGLYKALFCLDLLSEMGHQFNRDQSIAFNAHRTELLAGALHRQLSVL